MKELIELTGNTVGKNQLQQFLVFIIHCTQFSTTNKIFCDLSVLLTFTNCFAVSIPHWKYGLRGMRRSVYNGTNQRVYFHIIPTDGVERSRESKCKNLIEVGKSGGIQMEIGSNF